MKSTNFVFLVVILILTIWSYSTNAVLTQKYLDDWTIYWNAKEACLDVYKNEYGCKQLSMCWWSTSGRFCNYEYPQYKNLACRTYKYDTQQYVTTGKTSSMVCDDAAKYNLHQPFEEEEEYDVYGREFDLFASELDIEF